MAPTISSLSPNYGGASSGQVTVTGTGFSTVPKATRFVNSSLVDILTGVYCTDSTTCTGSVRADLAAPGAIVTISVRALVGGEMSAGTNFIYYGKPTVSSLSPSFTSTPSSSTAYVINGAAFTSNGTGFPGTTSIYLYTSVSDLVNGCGSTTSCSRTAPAVTEAGIPHGNGAITILTPGGVVEPSPYFRWGGAPATPTVTAISPSSGPLAGGQAVTISGTNFITGTQGIPSGGFGDLRTGTIFSFNIPGVGEQRLTSVNCSTTTSCVAQTPAGVSGGTVDLRVVTVCPASSALCGGANTRPALSIPASKTAAYSYPGLKFSAGGATQIYVSETGQSAQFTVQLHTQPTANVSVVLSMSPVGQATLSPVGALTFTTANWNVPQTVTVTGVQVAGTGDSGFSVVGTASSSDTNYGGAQSTISVVNVDDDTKRIYVSPQSGLTTTRSGGTATYTVVLTQAPTSPVTINLVSSDPLEGTVSPSSLTFATTTGGGTGWNVPRTVTVTGQNSATVPRSVAFTIMQTVSSADAVYGDPNLYLLDVPVTNTGDAPLLPPTVVTSAAGSIGPTSATLAGTVNPNSVSTTARFAYGLTNAYGSLTTAQAMGSGSGVLSIGGGAIAGLSCGTTYHFRATANSSAGTSNGIDRTFTTTLGGDCAFTDVPVTTATPVKLAHLSQLRTRINAVRGRIGMAAFTWATSPVAGSTLIAASHITELRTALSQAYVVVNGSSGPSYTDPTLSAGLAIKAIHINQLRDAVVALEALVP